MSRWTGILIALGVTCAGFAAEKPDRGAVAFPTKEGGVYIGWRMLGEDAKDVAFDVYRSERAGETGRKLNAQPIIGSTNFVDSTPGAAAGNFTYFVRTTDVRARAADSGPVTLGERAEVGGFKRIKLQVNSTVQMAGVADLDGDGKLDYLVKYPDFNVDPNVPGVGYWKPSPEPYKIEAYRHDGSFMWRYDMGPGIETGIWYSPIIAYDLDGDGKAEVYCKAGPKDPSEIVRHARGMVVGGPEFLVKLDGATGRELARIPWPDRDGIVNTRYPAAGAMGDYNYQSRNLLGIAYLDGQRPHLIVERGTYTQIKIRAYDPALKLVWSVDTTGNFSGQGTHGMQVADVDGDGRDEVIIGAAAISHDGKPLWTTGRGHPDACYVGKIDPARPGMQVYLHHEWKQNRDGLCLVDARTGETIWGYGGPTTHIHSSGLVADIDPTRPGMEMYGGEANGSQWWLYDARGVRIGNKSMGGLSPKAVWWEDSPTKVLVSGGKMFRFRSPTDGEVAEIQDLTARTTSPEAIRQLGAAQGPPKVSVNELWAGYVGQILGPLEGKIVGIADCLGDWREELIVSVPGELRIYSTTIPATRRRPWLMDDRQYRTSVARQMMGYFYPPLLGGDL